MREVTRSLTSLLALTSDGEAEDFEPHFDEVESRSLADVYVEAGDPSKLHIGEKELESFDSVYVQIKPEASIFARVALECIHNSGVRSNLDDSSFFIMAKKNYLFKVLDEKEVPIPPTLAVSTEKGLTEVEKNLSFPVVARMYEGFKRVDIEKIYDLEGLKSFAEHSTHGKSIILVQEFLEGEVYDSLFIDGEIVSLKLDSGPWDSKGSVGRQYHSLSSDQREIVKKTADSIGTPICRVRLIDDKVVQVESNPMLDRFAEESGKNVYGKVASFLKGDSD